MSSIVNYVADGSTTEFQIPFTYISEAHVVVTIDGTATSAFTFLNSSTLQMTTAPTAGSKLQIQRTTPVGALVDFTDGSTLFEGDLDLAHQQNRLIAEESKDIANVAKTTIDNNIADVNTVAGIAADVTNVASRGVDVTSVADNMAEVLLADTNAATATTKAAEAVVSANTASAQATISTNKATESSASAAAALASQNAAQQARTDTDASEALALAYKNSAQTSATTATTKASEASQSATTASSQAATATQKASEASTDAGIALAQAAVATTKAAAASTSESNALSYKDTALAASSASETARAASVVAKDASQVAQTASEAARDAASASETAAATSETNAATSAATATTQAGIATTKAGEAAASATASASSATASEAAKDAALAALDSFDDRYLGTKASDPTVDNDGNALVSGSLYFNTTTDSMMVYEGSAWVAAYASLSGALLAANNLSDLASSSAGRTNLGLGTAATTASTDYATAAQGTLAASATQPGDLATVATSGAYGDLSGTPTLGTAATSAATDFVAVTGDSMTGNLSFGDNDKAIFGSGSDLQVYHDGSSSYIEDAGTGNLIIKSNTLVLADTDGDNMLVGLENGEARLYNNGSQKLATKSTGIDVTGTVTADGLTVDDGGSNTNIRLQNTNSGSGSTDGFLIQHATNAHTYVWNYENADTVFGTNATERLRISSSGNAHITDNTNGPDAALHIEKTTPQIRLQLNGNSGYNTIESGGVNELIFGRSGSEHMRLDASGSLLVGGTSVSPATDDVAGIKLSATGAIQASVDGNAALFVNRKGAGSGTLVDFRHQGAQVGSIGTTSGDLTIDGPSEHTGLRFEATDITPRHNGGLSNGVNDLGTSSAKFKDAHFSGTVNAANFNTTSDATLKTNVETLTGSLDAVKSLRGVSFDWLENGNSEVGVIAQEVEAVLPDVVSTNDQGIKSVKYGNMVALLIEAMKEQQLRIEALEARLGE